MTPQEALSRVPEIDLAGCTVTTIDGGLSNRNYLVVADADKYVLRLDTDHSGTFPVDRSRELKILRRASDAGLAPEPVYAAAGILLCRWLPGRPWESRDLLTDSNLVSVAALLQRVHVLPLCGEKMNLLAIASRYAEMLRDQQHLSRQAARCLDIISAIKPGGDLCCCHGDIVAANIIATPELKLIDWEYACDADPLFDIASLVGFHDLNDAQARTLLVAYSGNDHQWEHLQAQVRLYNALQWLWFANRQAISPDALGAARLRDIERRLSPAIT